MVGIGVLASACGGGRAWRPSEWLRGGGGRIEALLVGDVTAGGAVLWGSAARAGRVIVELRAAGAGEAALAAAEASAERGSTFELPLERLEPGARYEYRVRREGAGEGDAVTGSFATAPRADDPAPVRFAFGGDVGGQDACRDAETGYAIFDEIARREPDFFVGLGDMIYADSVCSARGVYGNAQVAREVRHAADLEAFRAHWRYNRADAAFQRLMARTSYVAVWDDHETVNDVGPLDDTREGGPYTAGVHLLPIGLRAFLEQNPLRESDEAPGRLYRALRWGRHLEVFVLDTREYRDSDRAPDSDAAPKTMLGREQRAWLEQRLAASDATWKVVVSSVPISLPTGSARKGARDGWASLGTETGYERELGAIFETLAAARARNLLFITTDIHFGAAFRYTPVARDPDFRVYELASGPLHAGLWRTEVFDPTFRAERLALHAAPKPAEVATLEEARRWFNFGALAIDGAGRLRAELVNGYGEVVYALELAPE